MPTPRGIPTNRSVILFPVQTAGSPTVRLREVRQRLEDELWQLEAAVHIYTELARRLAASTRIMDDGFRPRA
jgi:hypothetical protein